MTSMLRNPRTFFVKTYGCQMNELDSQIMTGVLTKRGLSEVKDETLADLLIFNTCSIRDLAERKALGKIGILGRRHKRDRVIGITGCMANAKKDLLLRKLPHVDFVLGTNNLHDLDIVLDLVTTTNQRAILTDDEFKHELDYTAAIRNNPAKAYVSIIRGCNKFCTYCVVPYTRGPEVSRKSEDILQECKLLLEKGCKEITLLGQNVNSYGKDFQSESMRFHDLLYEIDKLPYKKWVRFLTSHPVDITTQLMEAIRDLESLCEHVHFPLQAGSNRILRKMHRIYTKEIYMEKVAQLREIIPDVALGTDMIVGFPTETEEEFQETLSAMQDVRYAHAFLYTYSQRKGTPAMRWVDDISEEVKADRHARIFALYEEISSSVMQSMLGQEIEVLVERRNKDSHHLKGVSKSWHNVIFEGDDHMIGTFQRVRLHSFSHHTFIATLI